MPPITPLDLKPGDLVVTDIGKHADVPMVIIGRTIWSANAFEAAALQPGWTLADYLARSSGRYLFDCTYGQEVRDGHDIWGPDRLPRIIQKVGELQ